MAALNYPIAGPPRPSPAPADGSVPIRRELRDLQRNFPEQFHLYIQGLDALQKRPATSDLSYYGIAGIHGRPYRSWGGSRQNNASGWQGYCTHSSILFAPWHRPYLSLFEQNLYEEVVKVAATYPTATRARYQAAAATFRAPYWDWAANPPSGETFFPSAFSSQNISIVTPQSNGQAVQFKNPLYQYRFNPLNPNGNDFSNLRGTPYDQWTTTLRYPSSTRSPSATSQLQFLEPAAASQIPSIQGDTYVLLTDPSYKSLEAFSSNEWHQPTRRTETSNLGSLEDLHGSIHGLIGGPMGHFSQLQYSAFDPIFWLHHANVDRLFAIWQAINPRAYDINKEEIDGTFSITAGTIVNQNTPLPPFNDATGRTLWTSATARRTEAFNYAYPETQRWRFRSDAEYINNVQQAVYQLYGGVSRIFRRGGFNARAANVENTPLAAFALNDSVPPVVKAITSSQKPLGGSQPESKPAAVPSNQAPAKEHKTGFLSDLGHKIKDVLGADDDKTPKDGTRGGLDLEAEIGKPGPKPEAQDSSYVEYICTLKGPKHILEQTYTVHVFIGEFDGDTKTWCTQDALVGTFVVFGKALTTGCKKCARDAEAELEVSGTVNLTAALLKEVDAGHLGSVERENVIPWLRQNLHWRVTLADGTEKERAEVPHLKVGVVSTVVRLPAGGLPEFSGVYEVHTDVTQGRPAGLNPSPTTGTA